MFGCGKLLSLQLTWLTASAHHVQMTMLLNMCLSWRAENSETQMGTEMTYKMLVRAIHSESGEELAQLVSESFIVRLATQIQILAWCMLPTSQQLILLTGNLELLLLHASHSACRHPMLLSDPEPVCITGSLSEDKGCTPVIWF